MKNKMTMVAKKAAATMMMVAALAGSVSMTAFAEEYESDSYTIAYEDQNTQTPDWRSCRQCLKENETTSEVVAHFDTEQEAKNYLYNLGSYGFSFVNGMAYREECTGRVTYHIEDKTNARQRTHEESNFINEDEAKKYAESHRDSFAERGERFVRADVVRTEAKGNRRNAKNEILWDGKTTYFEGESWTVTFVYEHDAHNYNIVEETTTYYLSYED